MHKSMRSSTDLLCSEIRENYLKNTFKTSGNSSKCKQQMKNHLFKKINKNSKEKAKVCY